MAALRKATSPVPLVFHRATVAVEEVAAEASSTAAAAAEVAVEERVHEAEARPDSNWRIVNIG
jgi:hypothetical protein